MTFYFCGVLQIGPYPVLEEDPRNISDVLKQFELDKFRETAFQNPENNASRWISSKSNDWFRANDFAILYVCFIRGYRYFHAYFAYFLNF